MAALEPLRARFSEPRWTSRELMHLTLVFLGNTDSARVPAITAALRAVSTRHSPYASRTGEAGARLDDRPGARRGGVAWLRLDDGGHETAQLALDVDRELVSHEYDATHSPRPHLTVGRNVHRAELDALRELASNFGVAWQTSRITLFRSYTSPHGSRYEVLADFPLTGKPTSARLAEQSNTGLDRDE